MRLRIIYILPACCLICCAIRPSFGQQPPARSGTQENQPAPTAAPFQLDESQRANLEAFLQRWEAKSSQIKTFYCDFRRWQYNLQFGDPNQPFTEGVGELRYSRPDKGMFRVTQQQIWQPAAGGKPGGWGQPQPAEHWVCDGKSLYEVDPEKKQIREIKLPPELQGVWIADGPLPFMFNTTAAELKARYWMRIVPTPKTIDPDQAKDQIWLEAQPRRREDAANFDMAIIILSRSEMLPEAMMLVHNGNSDRYVFSGIKTNDALRLIKDFFVAPIKPFGWKWIVEEAPQQRVPQNVTLPPTPTQQANRTLNGNTRPR